MFVVTTQLSREDRKAAEALLEPQPELERFDLDVRTAMQCSRCQKFCYGPRRFMREAMKEHWATTCPARRTKADAPMVARILVPKQ